MQNATVNILYVLMLLWLFVAPVQTVRCQFLVPSDDNYDTNYIESFTEDLTSRLFSSIKYANFSIQNWDKWQALRYNTNRRLILGFGANYSIFGLNIGFNFPFNRQDEDKYGVSDYLDLQTHLYSRNFLVDLYLQYYHGYYIPNPTDVLKDWPDNDTFPKRSDIENYAFGFNFQYMFNGEKFSYKAAFTQNEWQKRSAGSFTAGVNAFYVINRGDSTLIPHNIVPQDLFYGLEYRRSDLLNVGISGGYYYTLVIARHFFITAGLSAGPSIGYTWLDRNDQQNLQTSGVNLNFNALGRAAVGYNSKRVYVGVSFLHQVLFNQLPVKEIWSRFNTGNLRVNLVYRFRLKKPIKLLNPKYWKFLNKNKE